MEIYDIVGLLTDASVGVLALIVLWQVIRTQSKQDQSAADTNMAMISAFSSLVSNINASTQKLQGIEASVNLQGAELTVVHDIVEATTGTFKTFTSSQNQKWDSLFEKVSDLPDAVYIKMVDDFEAIGNSLTTLSQQSQELNEGVKQARVEWSTIGGRLARFLKDQDPKKALPPEPSANESTSPTDEKRESFP